MNRHDAGKAAEELAKILLDVDVLADRVGDIARSDEEFTNLAIARKYAGHAARDANHNRRGECEEIQYDLDQLAIDRLRDLLVDRGVALEDVSGPNSVVTDGVAT